MKFKLVQNLSRRHQKIIYYIVYLLLFLYNEIWWRGNSSATTRLCLLDFLLSCCAEWQAKQDKGQKEKMHTHFYVLLPLIMTRTIQFECQNERINRRGMDINRGKSKKQDLQQQMQYNLNYCLTCEEKKKFHA